MPFQSRLTHIADIFRPTVSIGELKKRSIAYPDDPTTSGHDCQLVEGFPESAQRDFGRDVEADGVIHFPKNADVKPDNTGADGKPDKIRVTAVEPDWSDFDNLTEGWQENVWIQTPSGEVVLTWDDVNSQWVNEFGNVLIRQNATPAWELFDNQGGGGVTHALTSDTATNPISDGAWTSDRYVDHAEAPGGPVTLWYAVAATNNKTFDRGVKVAVRRFRGSVA
jgi:hypothetical protein